MFISKYVTKIEFDNENVLLFNKFNGALYLIPNSDLKKLEHELCEESLSDNRHLNVLIGEKFVVEDENVPVFSKKADYFLVTVELSNNCNLKCKYCYETDQDTRKEISNDVLDDTLEYIEKVFINDNEEKDICIGYIGGEPLFQKEKLLIFSDKVKRLCEKYSRKVWFHIDTNGTIPFEDLFEKMENLHVSVSLTEESDHNKNRPGKGFNSYKRIVENLAKIERKEGNSLSLRYNTNKENIECFEEFVVFIKKNIPVCDAIEPMYTDEYVYNDFKNDLSLEDFRVWNSSKAIDILINNGFMIGYSLGGRLSACIAYQKYSCKVYSDGIVTLCDAMLHNQSVLKVVDLCKKIELLDEYFGEYKNYNPMNDLQCRECKEISLCMGKLFCRENKCSYSRRFDYNILAKTFVSYCLSGKGDMFNNI